MRNRFLSFALLLLVAMPAFAGDLLAKVRDQVVNSLSVTGTIEIDPEGKVVRYEIANADAYTQGVRDVLARTVPRWTFHPVLVDGVPRAARADMYLRLEATPAGGDQYRVGIASAAFGREEHAPGSETTARNLAPPAYPWMANRARVGAQVVTVVRVGRSGKVEDAVVEQTNLRIVSGERMMDRWRAMFESAALAAAKRWTFDPPTVGKEAEEPYWSVRVPIVYVPAGESGIPVPGQWESYVPGPRHRVPWDTDEQTATADAGIDALPRGGVFPLHQGLRLLTPLNAG